VPQQLFSTNGSEPAGHTGVTFLHVTWVSSQSKRTQRPTAHSAFRFTSEIASQDAAKQGFGSHVGCAETGTDAQSQQSFCNAQSLEVLHSAIAPSGAMPPPPPLDDDASALLDEPVAEFVRSTELEHPTPTKAHVISHAAIRMGESMP